MNLWSCFKKPKTTIKQNIDPSIAGPEPFIDEIFDPTSKSYSEDWLKKWIENKNKEIAEKSLGKKLPTKYKNASSSQ